MKYIKLFDTTANMNAAIANSTIGFLGMAENNGNPVIRRVPTTPPTPSHDYVEIGGVKWATMNIGAESVTDYGLYFQWGDTQGYTASQVGEGEGKKYFGKDDYLYYNDGEYTKYNPTDKLITLESSDDAVAAAWGGNWRMPTTTEFQTLGEAVNAVWTTNYNDSGVNGLVCTDKTDNSKVLFFPAAGCCESDSVGDVGSKGLYWSSSLASDSGNIAFKLHSTSSYTRWGGSNGRYYGLPARGILDD